MKSMDRLIRDFNAMKMEEDFEERYEFRCCFECYHFGEFMGYDYPICELSGKGVKNPFAYTDCDGFRVYDGVDGSLHRFPTKAVKR